MIEKILYANLDRRPDRNAWFVENMELAGVPMDIVERIPAKDWKDYNSVKDTVKAMQKDGLGLNFSLPHIRPVVFHWKLRAFTAQFWTMAGILKRIINDKKNTLVLHDDFCVREWEDLVNSLRCFDNYVPMRGGLHLIKLEWGVSIASNFPTPSVSRYNERWNCGVFGLSEGAIIYMPSGARRMFALQQGLFDGHPESLEDLAITHFNNNNSFTAQEQGRFVIYAECGLHSDIEDSAVRHHNR